jgi:hypothetical protein
MNLTVTLLLTLAPTAASAHGFSFTLPPGWHDLSPGTRTAELSKAQGLTPPDGNHLVFYATDLKNAPDWASLSVIVETGPMRHVTKQTLAEFTRPSKRERARQSKEGKVQLLESGLVTIRGVVYGRFVELEPLNGTMQKQVTYLIPRKNELAIVSGKVRADRWENYLQLFDAFARAVEGAEEP